MIVKDQITSKMFNIIRSHLYIIIPARNEEETIGSLIKTIKKSISKNIVVVNNGSTDNTAKIVKHLNVHLITEQRPGYGSACLAGINYLNKVRPQPKFVVFFDADGQGNISDIVKIATPVINRKAVYCHGSRMILSQARLNLTRPAQFANTFFAFIFRRIWHQTVTDLGPLRCLSFDHLNELQMKSTGYGWTIEMTSKILKSNLKAVEIPVGYNKRKKGKSKISGNISTALRAVFIMALTFIFILVFWKPKP